MTSKEYLRQVRKIDTIVRNKKETLESLEAKIGIQGVNFESDGSFPATRNVNRTSEMIMRIIELKDEINRDIANLLGIKREVMRVIDSLNNPDEINLLYLRYIQYMKWEDIAVEMNYSYPHIHRIHASALKNLEKKISQ